MYPLSDSDSKDSDTGSEKDAAGNSQPEDKPGPDSPTGQKQQGSPTSDKKTSDDGQPGKNEAPEKGTGCAPPVTPNPAGKETQLIGPQLPPHLLKKTDDAETVSMGPALPPHMLKRQGPSGARQEAGPALEQDEEETYGPLPVGAPPTEAHIALEERALRLKMDRLGPSKDQGAVREEWMVELPQIKAPGLGLGPRQFRSKAGPDFGDRSSWTDTPDKKKAKKGKPEEVDPKKEAEMAEARRRDAEQEEMSSKCKKKRPEESLLELHQGQLKKLKKRAQGASVERRPFSRDVDLQANRFDEAQKKAILKKAQQLDDRFSQGKSKFL